MSTDCYNHYCGLRLNKSSNYHRCEQYNCLVREDNIEFPVKIQLLYDNKSKDKIKR